MSDKLQEALIKCLYREAVTSHSPGLPGFGGYPGKDGQSIQPQQGCANLPLTNKSREENPTQPLRGWKAVFIYSQGRRQSAATLGSETQPLRGKEIGAQTIFNDCDFNFRGAIDNIGTNFKILTEDHL